MLPETPVDPWRLSVAPMMEWTDRHFRFLLRLLSPGTRLYTEMVVAPAIVHGNRERFLGHSVQEHPLALQLGGSDPDLLAQAARIAVEDFGYDEVNLNVGCPSDRVKSGRFGACLMLEADRVAACVAAMRQAVDVPVTVKTRLGVDDHDDYAFLLSFIDTVAQAGCDTFMLHARKAWLSGLSPKQNREVPPLDYPRVHRVKRERPALRIVINGGLDSLDGVISQLQHVDGVMIGRMAYGDPLAFARIAARVLHEPVPRSRSETVLAFEPYMHRQHAAGVPLKVMTRHLCGLFSGCYGAKRWRRAMSDARVVAEHGRGILRYGLTLVDEAREVPPPGIRAAAAPA
jgi:tRNA-dihydrouridine synthase A